MGKRVGDDRIDVLPTFVDELAFRLSRSKRSFCLLCLCRFLIGPLIDWNGGHGMPCPYNGKQH
jgi:hypothetical protein